MATYRAISGAACKVYLASTGQEIGWATSLNVSENIQNARVDVVGDIDSKEIVPVRRTATASVSAIRIQRAPLEAAGAWSVGDTADLLAELELDLAVIDDNTGETLLTLQGCRPTSRSFRVDSQSLFTEDLSFDVRRLIYP